jgi:photosynthetic reaction center cytochrome c subunit
MNKYLALLGAGLGGLLGLGFVYFTFERPPVDTTQVGFRGTSMGQVTNPRLEPARVAANQVPELVPPIPAVGPLARDVYQNVPVLGDLTVGQFTRLMVAITNWVAPTEGENAGCNYCHAGDDLATDNIYTKVVSRRMLQMTAHINKEWKSHVGGATGENGVTCYTCHRGQPVPAYVWSANDGAPFPRGLAGDPAGQNRASASVGMSSLPFDPFSNFLAGNENIRVISSHPLPTGTQRTIKQTEWTYGLMMHISQGLGVNCTFCHNTRSMADWQQSNPQRNIAWYGIRMVRAANNDYMTPLTSLFPPHRLGPQGDVLKVNCATCHQGINKPLYGAPMLSDYPELGAARP